MTTPPTSSRNMKAPETNGRSLSRQVVAGRAEDTREGRRLAIDLTLADAKVKFDEMRGYLDQLTDLDHGEGR